MAATSARVPQLSDERDAMQALACKEVSRAEQNAALTFLIGCWYEPMLRWARRLLRGHAGAAQDLYAEDIVQEAFAALYFKAASYDPQHPFAPWLRAIVRNRACNVLRRERRQPALPLLDQAVADDAASPLEQLVLEDLLDHLPEEERELVRAHYLHRECVAEIALRWRRTPSQVYQALYRARRQLRSLQSAAHTPRRVRLRECQGPYVENERWHGT
jgi:RNA polymerase sigma-70 factor (ECF subfamily)